MQKKTAQKWAGALRDAGLVGETYRPVKKPETIKPEPKNPDAHIDVRAKSSHQLGLTVVARERADDR